jgi:hypothetical protein
MASKVVPRQKNEQHLGSGEGQVVQSDYGTVVEFSVNVAGLRMW